MEALFQLFDGHHYRQGYITRGGPILDASIVPVPRNHNTRDVNKIIKNGEVPEDWADKLFKRSNERSYSGLKGLAGWCSASNQKA